MKQSKKRLSRVKRDSLSLAVIVTILLGSAAPTLAAVNDDPLVTMVLIDGLEVSSADESNPWVLHGQAWVGHDLKKIWFKTEVENADSDVEEAEIGLQGLAPYYFEIDSAFFIAENGHTALRLDMEYELLFTQRLILTPEIEVNFYGQNDAEFGTGSGLSNIETGLRLRYEIRREFAPYIGVNWSKSFGNTAGFSRDEGEDVEDLQWVIGVRVWF